MKKKTKFCKDCCREYPINEYNCMCGYVFPSSDILKYDTDLKRVIKAGNALIKNVMERYKLEKETELTCPYMKELASSLKSIKKHKNLERY